MKIVLDFYDVESIPAILDASTLNEVRKLEISKAVAYIIQWMNFKINFFNRKNYPAKGSFSFILEEYNSIKKR